MHTERITLKMHAMAVNCTAECLPLKELQRMNQSRRGEHFGVALYHTPEIKKIKTMCVHVCVPCPALPSCLPPDLICIYRLLENHVFVLKAKTYHCSNIFFSFHHTEWGKKRKRQRKMLKKKSRRGENDEREREKRH